MNKWKDIFRHTCRNHYFEKCTQQAHKDKHIYIPIYLSLGSEHIPPIVLSYFNQPLVFPQHRSHSWLLSGGAPIEAMAKELLGTTDGINKGMGGSPSMSWKPNIFGHSGLLGDQIPIATGAAHACGKATVCVLGDAAAEEDYALGAFGFAVTKNAPVLYICEDNDLSILTEKSVRRSWDIVKVVKAMGMYAEHVDGDNPSAISYNVKDAIKHLPAFLNINIKRQVWHSGSGVDGEIKTTTLDSMKHHLEDYNGLEKIELEAKEEVESIWQRLLKP